MELDIKNLTDEQRRILKAQLEAEEKAQKEKERRERETYEQLKDAQVRVTFRELQNISSMLEHAKLKVFRDFEAILAMKKELFGLTEDRMLEQESHTFTTSDGSMSIIIGHNVIDSWDETVSVGIQKVNQWLTRLARDEESAVLVGLIRDLLKPNKDGVLKANRILDLSKKASELGDPELIEAVELIRDAYRPTRTSTYVKARYVDEYGRKQWLALSMSAV
ncbi:DUF3164 family protein [Tenuifilum osseticum]|uniref:DUF3164 family protein n=1 Tax=Tenuifilum osseticum TaxID=3374723 RepID=UPI0034E40DD5